MFGIGFHESEYVFYEGPIGFGRAVWPSPVLSPASVIARKEDANQLPEAATWLHKVVFREDSFDPVTRIRRGRLFKWADGYAQPYRWQVEPHPAYSTDMTRGTQ